MDFAEINTKVQTLFNEILTLSKFGFDPDDTSNGPLRVRLQMKIGGDLPSKREVYRFVILDLVFHGTETSYNESSKSFELWLLFTTIQDSSPEKLIYTENERHSRWEYSRWPESPIESVEMIL